jgi:hypothetical protein
LPIGNFQFAIRATVIANETVQPWNSRFGFPKVAARREWRALPTKESFAG